MAISLLQAFALHDNNVLRDITSTPVTLKGYD